MIAGYHWFTDWGRDTMISLEGLTLATGRAIEARWILRTFAHYVRDGLIPNLFPEGQNQGLYPSANLEGHRAASSRRHPVRYQGRPA
jgi:predicted glycogen debranching enzyme